MKAEFNAREAIIEKFCRLIVGRGGRKGRQTIGSLGGSHKARESNLSFEALGTGCEYGPSGQLSMSTLRGVARFVAGQA